MTRALVTGASGFIGTHLLPQLRAAKFEVDAISSRDGDIADAATWELLPPCDVLVHLAGRSSIPDSWADPAAFIRTNVVGTVHGLEYARRHGARVVYMSSYLYGHAKQIPTPEDAPLDPTNPYALSKKLAEDACRFFAESHDMGVTVLRIFNVYGPGQPGRFMVAGIIAQAREGKEIRVKDLEMKRDYVHVEDVSRAIVAAAKQQARFSILNIASGVSHSAREVVDAVQSACGTTLPVLSSGERRRKDELMDTVADIRLARSVLGWEPLFDLAQGIAHTCGVARATDDRLGRASREDQRP